MVVGCASGSTVIVPGAAPGSRRRRTRGFNRRHIFDRLDMSADCSRSWAWNRMIHAYEEGGGGPRRHFFRVNRKGNPTILCWAASLRFRLLHMPRFGTKSLLVSFAVAAVWLSTFSGYWAAQDV